MVAVTSANAPAIGDAPRRHILYQHFVVPQAELPHTIGRSFPALYGRIAELGVIPAGPPFVVYHSMGEPWDLDVCAPVARAVTPSSEFAYAELPASRAVTLLHIGPYETLGVAYEQVKRFVEEQGLAVIGAPREFYLSPPETPPAHIQTILEWPVG